MLVFLASSSRFLPAVAAHVDAYPVLNRLAITATDRLNGGLNKRHILAFSSSVNTL